MPAALLPLLPAIIGAGGAIGSSLINRHGSSSSNGGSLLPPGLDQTALLNNINTQKALSGTFQQQGADLLGQGQHTLNQPLSYHQNILGGDRTAIMEQMAPGIAAINAQFRAPLTEAGISGHGSSLAPDLEASKQSAISNQIFQAQPAAADKLTGIASGLMNLGVSQEQAGAGILSDTGHELLDYNAIIRGIQAQQSVGNSNMFGQLGVALGPLLKQILSGIIPGGGPATPNAPPVNIGPILPVPPWLEPGAPDPALSNPALTSSLINLGSGGAPQFGGSWLDSFNANNG